MKSLAAIHVAKKQLGLDEDTYRAMLVSVTGKASSKDMSEAEREKVIEHLRKRGFTKASTARRTPLEGRFAKKLQALWIAAWNLGITRNRDDAALIAFVKRQTGIDHVRFLRDADDAKKAIEALKAWLKREGGVGWGNTNGQEWLAGDPPKIAWAQWLKLVPEASLYPDRMGFDQAVFAIVGDRTLQGGLDSLKQADWRDVMNDLGHRIRTLRQAQGED